MLKVLFILELEKQSIKCFCLSEKVLHNAFFTKMLCHKLSPLWRFLMEKEEQKEALQWDHQISCPYLMTILKQGNSIKRLNFAKKIAKVT